jgi:hypothetical protein
MRRLREYVAAGIALVIIIGAIVLVGISFAFISTSNDEFTRVKDLLLFVNPLLGVVIGYYFNKVSSDQRAETAENRVDAALTSAQDAEATKKAAQEQAKVAANMADEMRTTLEEVTQKAGEMVDQAAALPAGAGSGNLSFGDLGGDGTTLPTEALLKTRVELQSALERANRLLQK